MGQYVVFEVGDHREQLWAWAYHDGHSPHFESVHYTQRDGVTPVVASRLLDVDPAGPELGRFLFAVRAAQPPEDPAARPPEDPSP